MNRFATAKKGPIRHASHDRLVDALRRGTRIRWDAHEPFGSLRLPGDGALLFVAPWHVEAAFREVIGHAAVRS